MTNPNYGEYEKFINSRIDMVSAKNDFLMQGSSAQDNKPPARSISIKIRFKPRSLEVGERFDYSGLDFKIKTQHINCPQSRFVESVCLLVCTEIFGYVKTYFIGLPNIHRTDVVCLNIERKNYETSLTATTPNKLPYEILDFKNRKSIIYNTGYGNNGTECPLPPFVTSIDGRTVHWDDASVTLHHEKGVIKVIDLIKP